jgi:hypothetical protein
MGNYLDIIALIIITVAFSVAGYKLFRQFRKPVQGCNGCASDCSGCQLQDLKTEIEENKKRKAG